MIFLFLFLKIFFGFKVIVVFFFFIVDDIRFNIYIKSKLMIKKIKLEIEWKVS